MQVHEDPKLDIIAHALIHKGIPIWNGIPEHIVEQLKANGYKIKKRKKFKAV
jgi:hypothetical protein